MKRRERVSLGRSERVALADIDHAMGLPSLGERRKCPAEEHRLRTAGWPTPWDRAFDAAHAKRRPPASRWPPPDR